MFEKCRPLWMSTEFVDFLISRRLKVIIHMSVYPCDWNVEVLILKALRIILCWQLTSYLFIIICQIDQKVVKTMFST